MGKLVVRHFSMPEKISRLIDQLAQRDGMNKSEFVRAAVRFYAKAIMGGGNDNSRT